LHDRLLPVCVQPFADESGMGCCLRAAAHNACSLSQLRRLLGVGENEQFKHIHSERLSQATGIHAGWLAHALPTVVGYGAGARLTCYGHSFRSRMAFRTRVPQVCWACIRQFGYAKASWDLGLSTVCTVHECDLTDRCQTCGASLRWDRPDINWGHCGHGVATPPASRADASQCTGLQSILDASLMCEPVRHNLAGAGLFEWLDGLSPNGWTDLVMAFGSQANALVAPPRGSFSRHHSTDSARQIASTGWLRLNAWAQGEISHPTMRDLVAEPPLLGLLLEPATDLDQRIGNRIYSLLFGDARSSALRRENPALAQMSLFEDMP